MLHCLSEQSDEIRRTEVGAVHTLLLQVAVQVGQQYWDQSVQSIKVEFQHGQLCVEKRAQLKTVDYLTHHCKWKRFIFKEEIEEACDKVHALAVAKVWIDHSIGEQNLAQILIIYSFRKTERAKNVLLDLILNLLRKVY